jgi:hypothetical protein
MVEMRSGVCLRGETGNPEHTVLNGELYQGKIVVGINLDDATRIEGLTLMGGHAVGGVQPNGGALHMWGSSIQLEDCIFSRSIASGRGGAVSCWYGSPTFLRCAFLDSEAYHGGGGLFCHTSAPILRECIFAGNWAGTCYFAAITSHFSTPEIDQCTFSGNTSGICCCEYSGMALTNCIIAFSSEGSAFGCAIGSWATLTCCDLYGNADGDWVDDDIVEQYGNNGNIALDPMFCDDCPDLQSCSPCWQPDGCGQIGARGVGCVCGGGPSMVERESWSSVKGRYRQRNVRSLEHLDTSRGDS